MAEERDLGGAIALSNADDNTIRMFVTGTVASEQVKQAMRDAVRRKEQVAQASRELQHARDLLRTLTEDQARLRANLEQFKNIPEMANTLKRYREKFEKQDAEIEELNARIKALQEREFKERKAFDDYLVSLNVD